jgi:hypothetical protein
VKEAFGDIGQVRCTGTGWVQGRPCARVGVMDSPAGWLWPCSTACYCHA